MNVFHQNPVRLSLLRILMGILPVLILFAPFGIGCERTIPFPDFGPAEELEDPICRLQNDDDPDHIPAENTVVLHGLIVTAIVLEPDLDGNNYYVQNPAGCYGRSAQFSGAYVFDQYAALAPADLAVGDQLSMTATITEYYGLTELEPSSITRTGVGVGGVVPEIVQAADVATGGPLGEAYESVLIRIVNVAVIDEDIGYGEFLLEGGLRVDDALYEHNPGEGEVLASITGVLTFSYDDFKVLPRRPEDIVLCDDADGDDYYDDTCGGLDCDDTDAAINPDFDEVVGGFCEDGIDQDCDGSDCSFTCTDGDNDGYGDPASAACTHPERDCNDADENINPGVNELGEGLCDDGIDQDCDGSDCTLGDVFTIYQIQDTSDPDHPSVGTDVTLTGVIVTAVRSGGFWVEEPAGGAWSGIYVYDPSGAAPGDLAVGDEVTLTASYSEYNGLSELGFVGNVTRTDTGLAVPGPDVVDACDVGSFGAFGENWEGVLIRVLGPVVTDPDLGFGEFEVDGCLRVDDYLFGYYPEAGETFGSITGVHTFNFDDFKILPRSADDIVTCQDADGDGFNDEACGGEDCDDTDANINPDVDEVGGGLCDDGIDQDCDGSDCSSTCTDPDSDGYGDPASPSCTHPERDCDNTNADINPGVDEIGLGLCNDGIDQDCDGSDCTLGDVNTIYEIQDVTDPNHPAAGSVVTLAGVIVTAVGFEGFWVEEPAGGEWSGVYAYDPTATAPGDLAVGDELTFSGTMTEYYDYTELSFLEDITRTGQGLAVPGPDVVDACDIATGGSLAENYEGVLVQVLGPVVTETDLGYGEFEVDDCLRIDDFIYLYEPALGEEFTSITGVLNYSFDDFKLEPRNDDDLVPLTACWDNDGDSYDDEACGGSDCDDANADVNPGVQEGPMGDATCGDTIDNDCDDDVDAADAGCSTATLPGDILIDELFYDPDGADGGYEYIILYNATGSMIDLDGWRIDWAGLGFDVYGTYDITDISIASGAQLVIGGDQMTPVPDVIHNFNFQNGGSESDGVRVVDSADNTIDTLIYDAPNDNALPGDGGLAPYPDGMCAPDVPSGKVLARDALHTDTDDCSADFSEGDPLTK